mmetsp:Transcript_10345/g.16868  ORF Transcript_10345/g.16868 Transcript_10345/m.16868 type:complete len:122 (+) Transcript_10345:858-1223(+)
MWGDPKMWGVCVHAFVPPSPPSPPSSSMHKGKQGAVFLRDKAGRQLHYTDTKSHADWQMHPSIDPGCQMGLTNWSHTKPMYVPISSQVDGRVVVMELVYNKPTMPPLILHRKRQLRCSAFC